MVEGPAGGFEESYIQVSSASNPAIFDQSFKAFTLYDPALFATEIPSLELITPNGGEEYFLGNKVEINWTSTQDESFVKIEFSIDNGVNWKTVVDSTINDHLYLWTITDWVDAKWLMRISHASDPLIYDISDGQFRVVVHPDDQDVDTDGFSVNEGDCNDSNDTVYPGAIEICDQVDNNCNGLVNENLDCRGDINADGVVDLVDVIVSLQILTDTTNQSNITLTGDVDNDQNIGVAEAIYGLRSVAGLLP